jgi:fimbrial chaperone protein
MLRGMLLLLALLLARPVAALEITPTTLTLSPGQARTELWLQNPGPVIWQGRIRIFTWDQTPGAEQLRESEDIVVSPATLELPPGTRQRVWVLPAPAAPPESKGEQAFRVLLEPSSPDLPRYSLPLFRTPTAGAEPRLHLRVDAGGANSSLLLENTGKLHARLSDLVFEAADGHRELLLPGLAGYILAGRQRHWPLPPRADGYAGGRFHARLQDRLEHALPPQTGHIADDSTGAL